MTNEPDMKMTVAELERTLKEFYRYYFSEARRLSNEADEESAYMEAKAHGGVEAIEAIFLLLFGGQKMYDLWQGEVARYDKTAGS